MSFSVAIIVNCAAALKGLLVDKDTNNPYPIILNYSCNYKIKHSLSGHPGGIFYMLLVNNLFGLLINYLFGIKIHKKMNM